MKTLGRYLNSNRGLNDSIEICLEVENENVVRELEENKDKDYFIEFELYDEKRSLQANRYLWKLCDLIGYKLRLSKDVIYLMKLADYGVYVDLRVRNDTFTDTLDNLRREFRYIDELNSDGNYKDIRCYIGSSHYSKKEMQRLLSGVVQDARDLGIDTWADEELNMMIKAWKG